MDLFKNCKTEEELESLKIKLIHVYNRERDICRIIRQQSERWTPPPKDPEEIIKELEKKLSEVEDANSSLRYIIYSLSKNSFFNSIKLLLSMRKEAKNAKASPG